MDSYTLALILLGAAVLYAIGWVALADDTRWFRLFRRKRKAPQIRVPEPDFYPDRIGPWS